MKKNKHYPYYEMPEITDFRHFVSFMEKSYAGRDAFMFAKDGQDIKVTYDKFTDDIKSLAAYLSANGLSCDRIALYGENSYEWIVSYFAAICSNNVIVPIDKELTGEELCNLVCDCEAKVLICSKAKGKIVEEYKSQMTTVEKYIEISEMEDIFSQGKALIDESGEAFKGEIDVNAMCALIYTSGTTGKPKGVMLSQRNLMYDMVNSCRNLLEPPDTVVVLPLNHTFGMMAGVLCQVYAGSITYINNNLRNVLKDINTLKPRHISVVPLFVETFYKGIWTKVRKQGKEKLVKTMIKVSNGLRKVGIDLRKILFKSIVDGFGGRLEMIISGGAPIDLKVAKFFEDIGITLISGFGITECSPIVSTDRNKDYKFGSVGLPIPGVEVKVENPNENGEGELLVKGPIVMLGYYKNPEATAETFEGEWFRTGDIGRIDDEGFVFITGRKKNIIITANGKNVYPEEIEAVIQKIEGINEVLVYGRDGVICAEIFAESEDQQERIKKEVQALNSGLASYKQVQKVLFRDTEFEKTSTKKIKRFLY